MDLKNRPRRLRSCECLRGMVRETRVSASSLIYPIFVVEGSGIKREISSMEGQYHYSVDKLDAMVEETLDAGVDKLLLFGVPDHKDECGSGAFASDGIVQRAVSHIKSRYPQMYLITDVCMCEYTSHGHCGILDGCQVDNDKTLPYLDRIVLSHVQAGADMVAPSDMMDGHIASMRAALDRGGFSGTPVMAYSAKYASAFYGPFREAAGSAPAFGDRRSYQMDCHNRREALREMELDVEEGADILMVKPALAYLDVIREAAGRFELPIAAYSVSGEYAMVKAAAKAGFLDEARVVCEMALGTYRAGADILISYYARELAGWIKEGRIG